MINKVTKDRIARLKAEYDQAMQGQDSLLRVLAEKEIPELVYNSNAIENSTLSLEDTEDIIFRNRTPKNADVREVYEAKNLANILEFLSRRPDYIVNESHILKIHKMLISGINEHIAGRFRDYGEHVRVGHHIAPSPEHVPRMIDDIIYNYNNDEKSYFLDKIAKFHARFEHIHPFNDGNGRTGRVIINQQLAILGYPPITILAKNKERDYYPWFEKYHKTHRHDGFTELLALLLCESLHKRIAYAKTDQIIRLAEWAKQNGREINPLLNAARRQTIPAFRERGSWMVGADYQQ
jgi:Fic family protein